MGIISHFIWSSRHKIRTSTPFKLITRYLFYPFVSMLLALFFNKVVNSWAHMFGEKFFYENEYTYEQDTNISVSIAYLHFAFLLAYTNTSRKSVLRDEKFPGMRIFGINFRFKTQSNMPASTAETWGHPDHSQHEGACPCNAKELFHWLTAVMVHVVTWS